MNTKTIVLAVDPYEPRLKPNRSVLRELRNLAAYLSARIELVYVLGNSRQLSDLIEAVRDAEAQLTRYAAGLQLGEDLPHRVLIERGGTRAKAVQKLIDHAVNVSAEMIALTSYGQRLVGRLVLGGFANILLARSPLPVLFLGGRESVSRRTNRVLFPTDLSAGSRLAFDRFLRQFEAVKPEIVLYTSPNSDVLSYQSLAYAPYIPEPYLKSRVAAAREDCEEWAHEARLAGYKTKVVVDTGAPRVATGILHQAKEQKVELIAMGSLSRGARLRTFGSTASRLFFARRFPLWVCGPEALMQEVSEAERTGVVSRRGLPREGWADLAR